MFPSPEAQAESLAWVLAEPFRVARGGAGDHLGQGTGASMEFQDHRAYVVGDDIRQVDWRAYGRSDQLLVRQHREEIAPRVELIIDASASMGVGEDKGGLAVDLPLLLWRAALAGGMAVDALLLGNEVRALSLEEFESRGFELDGRRTLPETLGQSNNVFTQGSLRILISDLLFPGDPVSLCERLARGAGGLLVVQLLGQRDVEPLGDLPAGQSLRLRDPETGQARDLVLDAEKLTRYHQRLERQTAGVREGLRMFGGRFLRITAGDSLASIARRELVPAGVLVPA